MKMPKMFCMMCSGLPLSEAASDGLYRVARAMIRQNKCEQKIYNDDVIGRVHTEFEKIQFVDTYGYKFIAEIQTDKGESYAEFLIRHSDIGDKKARWDKPIVVRID